MNHIKSKMINLKVDFYTTFTYDEDVHAELMKRMSKVSDKAREDISLKDDIIALQEAYLFYCQCVPCSNWD